MRTTLRLLSLAACSAFSPSALALQGGSAPFGVRDASALTAEPAERLVGVPVGVDEVALAASVGAQSLGAFGSGVDPLSPGGPGRVARFRWSDAGAAAVGAAELLISGRVLFAEYNVRAKQPESSGCGAHAPASAEQCTAAFVDGTPTTVEYVAQPAVGAIALDELPPPTGTSTIVAIVDTGLDPDHPLLVGRLAGPGLDLLTGVPGGFDLTNGIDDDGDGLVDEAYGHGTHVAGLIALVDPAARLLPFRVLDADGNGSAFDVGRAIHLAAEQGAHCINLSVGLAFPSAAVEEAVEFAADDDDGAVVVASAGNRSGQDVGFIATLEETIAVAAVDEFGRLAPFASYGPEVDVVAPGVDVYSAMPGDLYARWSGSSMSAAIVSGGVARLLSTVASSDPDEAREAIVETANPVDALNPKAAGLLGQGMIHLGRALDEL